MYIDKMCTHKPMKLSEYQAAFEELRRNLGGVQLRTVQHYMLMDPVNAKYLQNEAVQFLKQKLQAQMAVKFVGYTPSTVVIIDTHRQRVIPRQQAESVMQQIMEVPWTDSEILPGLTIVFAECIRCLTPYTYNTADLYLNPEFTVFPTMFNQEDIPTSDGLTLVYPMMHPRSYDGQTPLGICHQCRRDCISCGRTFPVPLGTGDIFVSYLLENRCVKCGAYTIGKLQVPKPSPLDLRRYKLKLIALGKGD